MSGRADGSKTAYLALAFSWHGGSDPLCNGCFGPAMTLSTLFLVYSQRRPACSVRQPIDRLCRTGGSPIGSARDLALRAPRVRSELDEPAQALCAASRRRQAAWPEWPTARPRGRAGAYRIAPAPSL